MDADEEGKEESLELNHLARNENKKEEDGSSIYRIAPDVSDPLERSPVVVQVQQQQQPQGSLVCWERFLHVRSLKVLLVETDDSTRHVLAALLRNCSYEVMEAANGVQAWKILEDLTYHIDLILTEVVMPCLSGIGLLCKIMSHKTRTHIPVIMMSSHDSMGLVFKCLSKGAVDFLVKPIRKNELKNLWQHVWRRCHSSSGSGSDNGIQTQNSESVEKSDNNTGSTDEKDDESIGAGSDIGSGTQSSWTKQAAEIDSPPTVCPWDHISKCPDSTCAQVICSNAETLVNKWEPMTATRRCQKQEEQLDGVEMGNDLEIGIPRNLDLHPVPNEVTMQLIGTKKNNLPEIDFSKSSEHIDEEQINRNNVSSSKLEYIAANLTGVITNTTDLQLDSTEFEASGQLSKISEIDKLKETETKELPSLELSLKRLRGVKDTGTSVQDDRKVLRRSDLSAFSRYITPSNVNIAFSGNVRSDSLPNNSLKVVKKDLMRNIQSDSSCNLPNQCSNEGSNNIDMGSTTRSAFTMPTVLKNKSMTTPMAKSLHPSFAPQVVSDKVHNKVTTPEMAQLRDPHQEVNIQHLHHHYDHHHHLFHNTQQQQLLPHHDEMSLKKLAAAAPHCGSSSLFHGRVEGIAGNYSLNGSASGSNNGSNGQNGSSTTVDAGGRNIGIGDGLAGKTESGDASGSGTGNRVDQDKIAQREAALTKFRLKRRERCFRKKVRYQNRKKLAEQRPRIRGQFAKQIAQEDTSRKSNN